MEHVGRVVAAAAYVRKACAERGARVLLMVRCTHTVRLLAKTVARLCPGLTVGHIPTGNLGVRGNKVLQRAARNEMDVVVAGLSTFGVGINMWWATDLVLLTPHLTRTQYVQGR